MTVNYTSLLGLALPVTGTEAGAWGDVVNNYLTSYLDASVAGTQTITGSQTAVTLAVTNGATLVTVGSGATGSAQFQIITCTGNPASLLTITAPASSRQYIIINSTSTSQSVQIVGAGPTTGVTIVSGEKAHVAWNGSDFVKIATQNGNGDFVTVDTTNLEVTNIKAKDGTASMTLADSTGVVTFSANPVLNAGTANGVPYLNASKVLTTGSALTFNGTELGTTSTGLNINNANALVRYQNGSGTRTGYFQVRADAFDIWSDQAAVPMVFGVANSEQMRLTTTGLGIGTNNPGYKLEVNGVAGVKANNANAAEFHVNNTNASARDWILLSTGSAWAGGGQTGYFNIYDNTAGQQRLTIDTSGNLGLGVTPSAWQANGKALEFSAGAIYSYLSGASGEFDYAYNAYFDGGWKYKASSSAASLYSIQPGVYKWFNAPSGTAGNPITFTQAMTLDASGNLLVGNTSLWSSERLGITGSSASQRFIYARTTSNGHYLSLGTNGTLPYIEYGNGAGLAFSDGTAERARITSGGTFQTSLDASIYGVTVGRGAGAVATNTAVGASALAANLTGSRNTAFGSTALTAVTTGSWNIGIGSQSLQTLQTGDFNIAVGGLALATANGCSFNVAMGQTALTSNTTGSNNTGIGYDALRSNLSASNNTAVGYQAGYNTLTIGGQTFIGALSGFSNTTGWGTALGYASLYSNTTGNNSTAIGVQALYSNTTASNNTAVGYQAGYSNTTGDALTAVGRGALFSNTTGTNAVALGYYALNNNTTGNNNVAVGLAALQANTTASNNTAVGYHAGYSNTTGAFNVAVGTQALTTNTGGERNVAVGRQSMYLNTAGGYNVSVGMNAMEQNTTASYNVAVGYTALQVNTTGANNTAIGTNALVANTTASNNTAVGYQAGYSNTTGTPNAAFGVQAGFTSTTGANNTFIGPYAGYYNTTGGTNTAVGSNALLNNTTASNNTAVGFQAGYSNTTGTYLTHLGYQAGYSGATVSYVTALGYQAGFANTAGGIAAVGHQALYSNTTGGDNTAVGSYRALYSNTIGSANTAVGREALQANTTASNNTAVGYQAGYSNTTGAGNVLIGLQAGYSNTTNSYNTFVGWQAGYLTTGTENTFVGKRAGYNATTGAYNTFVGSGGYGAGQEVTTGSKNTIVGAYNGNQGGLDIRTASNNIVISDGDGEPRLIYYNAAPLTKITGVLTHNFTDTQSKSQINLYDNTNGNTEIASGYATADFVVATGGNTGNLAYSARSNGYFVTNTGIIALINTTFTVGSNTYTVTASSSEGYIYCTPDPIGEAATGTLVGVKYATEGFRVLDDRTARFRSTIGVGNALGATSGAGITFPATQNASSNANTLDDYEQGSFTPTLGGTWTTSPTGLSGTYVKIGRQVYVRVYFDGPAAKNTSVSGWIDSLPFTVVVEGTGSGVDSNVDNKGNVLFANTSRMWLTDTSFAAGANYFSGTYLAAD